MRHAYRVFGRDEHSDEIDGPWWPLYLRDGPQLAASPEEALATVRERLELSGEADAWVELAAVPASEWFTAAAARLEGETE